MGGSGRAGPFRRPLAHSALWLVVLAATVSTALAGIPYNSSGVLPDGGVQVERGFVNWPLQVSLAARLLAAPPGPVVLMQCDWELWRHQALDIVGQRPVLCLSRHCGQLRVQKAALRLHRPGWLFHCLHAPGDYSEEARAGGRVPPPTSGSNTNRTHNSSRSSGGRNRGPKQGGGIAGDGRRQALSGMTGAEVEAAAANATLLVVGIPAGGGARLQPPVMSAMVRGMSHLAQLVVVSASERGRHLQQMAVIEAPLKRAKVLYSPYNRYYTEDGGGIYQASFWQAEESKARRAAVRSADGYARAMAPLQERVGAALSRLGVRSLSRLGVRSVVHAYMGAESWLPPVFARMAEAEAAREKLANLQRATGDGKQQPAGAETASLGARRSPAAGRPQPLWQKRGKTGKTGKQKADESSQPHAFHYFGLDTDCDQVQKRRREMGVGSHLVRVRNGTRPRAPVTPAAAAHVSWCFECLDAAHEGLPYGADLVATHDTLEHLPIESAFMFLYAVRASGARWLLISGFANGTAPNREPTEGVSGYYALDPSSPPFNLQPPPLHVFWEDEGGPLLAPGAVGDGVRGGAQAAAIEARRAGRRVVRLYDAQAMTFEDGLFDIFNYSSTATPPGAPGGQSSAAGGQQQGRGGPGGGRESAAEAAAAGTKQAARGGSSGGGMRASGAGRRAVPSARLPVVSEAGSAAAGEPHLSPPHSQKR